jgi:hypothetical protein
VKIRYSSVRSELDGFRPPRGAIVVAVARPHTRRKQRRKNQRENPATPIQESPFEESDDKTAIFQAYFYESRASAMDTTG